MMVLIMLIGVFLCLVLFGLIIILGGVSFFVGAQALGTTIFMQIQCSVFAKDSSGVDFTKATDILTIALTLVPLVLMFLNSITQVVCSATLAVFISTSLVYKNYDKLSNKTALIIVLVSLIAGIIVGIVLAYNDRNLFGFECLELPVIWNIASVISGIYIVIVTDILYVIFRVLSKTGTLKNIENIQKYKSIGIQGNILSLFAGVIVVFVLIFEVPKIVKKSKTVNSPV